MLGWVLYALGTFCGELRALTFQVYMVHFLILTHNQISLRYWIDESKSILYLGILVMEYGRSLSQYSLLRPWRKGSNTAKNQVYLQNPTLCWLQVSLRIGPMVLPVITDMSTKNYRIQYLRTYSPRQKSKEWQDGHSINTWGRRNPSQYGQLCQILLSLVSN